MEDETKGSCLAINFRGSSKRRDRDPDFEQSLSLLKDSEPAGFRLSAWTTSTVNSIEDDMLFPENPFYTEPVPTTVTPENQVKRPVVEWAASQIVCVPRRTRTTRCERTRGSDNARISLKTANCFRRITSSKIICVSRRAGTTRSERARGDCNACQ